MVKKDLTNVEEATGEFQKLPAGGYICKITGIDDVPDNEYLKVYYDIARGEYIDYFKTLGWNACFIRSYKDKALPFFKAFISAVEESNNKFKFDWNEQKMVGKYIGLVLGDEEYKNKNGEKKIRSYVYQCRGALKIKGGEFKVPELKRLDNDNDWKVTEAEPDLQEISDDDLPF